MELGEAAVGTRVSEEEAEEEVEAELIEPTDDPYKELLIFMDLFEELESFSVQDEAINRAVLLFFCSSEFSGLCVTFVLLQSEPEHLVFLVFL